MTKIEEKSFVTQIKLLNEIQKADHMILYSISSEAGNILRNVLGNKIYTKEGQTTVQLTVDELSVIRLFLARLSDQKALSEIDKGYVKRYIDEKDMKLNIVNQLQ